MVAWSFIEAIAGSSCEANIAVSAAKVAVVVSLTVWRYKDAAVRFLGSKK
jgi:hypothetical protein